MSSKDTESEDVEFIQKQLSQFTNHIVRQKDECKGIVNIEVVGDDSYNVKLHKGTDNKPVKIEDVSKTRLISMLEDKL